MSAAPAPDAMVWLRNFRSRIIQLLLAILVCLGTVGIVAAIFQHLQARRISFLLVYYSVSYGLIWFLLLARRISDHWRSIGLLAVIYSFSVLGLISGWLGGGGRPFLLAWIVLAAILIGPKAGMFAAVLAFFTYAGFGFVFAQGWLVYPYAPIYADPLLITIEGIGFAMAIGMVTIGLWFFREGLNAANQAILESQQARQQLARRAQELDELNQLLAERTGRLEKANQELEAFSYSVSHDLRTPLRAVDGYTRILQDDYAPVFAEDGAAVLRNIIQAASRMEMIIDDLLKLAQVTRLKLVFRPVDLSRLAEDVILNLKKSSPERQAEIHIQPDMVAVGDPNLLQIALENLLGNAWKFSSKQPVTRIDFKVCLVDSEAVFCVKDNGAGFDMAYANKLFGSFQRLHREDEFEGTGIGLAIVRRIIDRHNGRIWAQSKVGEGAQFFFSLGNQKQEI